MSRRLLLFFLLTVTPLSAQFPTTNESRNNVGTVRVEVVYSNGNPAPANLRVQLREGIDNKRAAMEFTNSSGTAEFVQLAPGEYTVAVTGDKIKPTESDTFTVVNGKVFQDVMVTIYPAEKSEDGDGVRSSASSIGAAELNVPKKAAKEFERASEEMAEQNWDKGIQHLEKATAIYPQYASAYNDLAVCYGVLGQKEKQREALVSAISVNDHFVPALVNLAHMEMKANHLISAVTLLNKAATTDPTRVEAISLLAQVEFMQGHYDAAIADARKAHQLPHQQFAIVHYTAASAFEKENRIPDAIAELQIFLQEEPQGARSDVVRKVLATMQSQVPNQNESQNPSH
jgi:tetratricopeptide (TPR) repeat protein